MALNFPDNPVTNEYFTDNTSGFTYIWNGIVWISVASTQTTSLKEFDDISGSFNSSTTTFSLTFNAGSTKVYPLSANQITIAIGGILQNAGDDFTISGDQITFTTAPDAGVTFQGMFYGSSVSMNSVAAGSITTSSLSTGGPIWNVGGDVTVAGIVTVGSSSVVIDGPSNEIRVGVGATVNESGIIIGGSGIVTATEFHGDGSKLSGIIAGIGTTGSINTSGIITASSFTGSGIGLTDIGRQMHAIAYSPGIGATGVGATSNIIITFNKGVNANAGTITLKEGAADGPTVESFDVFSDRISISGGKIVIDPTSDFSLSTSYYVAVPAGAYKDVLDTSSSPGISTYSFETVGAGGDLYTLGANNAGQLGQNDTVYYTSPRQIPGTWTNVRYGHPRQAATRSDGSLWVWGENNNGELGLNDVVDRSSPTQLPGTQWQAEKNKIISTGDGNSTMFIRTDGTLWGTGIGAQANLGQNNIIDYSSPVQIPGTQWDKIGKSRNHVSVTKTDGTLWYLGLNNNYEAGISGQNDQINRSSPVQIPGTQWKQSSGGWGNLFATKTDGSLWSWGNNNALGVYFGMLGLNDWVQRSSPTQIPGTQWAEVKSMAYATLALKTDGTLWAWGSKNYGNLGQNTMISYSSPVQIPGTQWETTYFATGRDSMTVTKTDGTLWRWGHNNVGQLGLNDAVDRSSPTQIPGTDWQDLDVGFYGISFIR